MDGVDTKRQPGDDAILSEMLDAPPYHQGMALMISCVEGGANWMVKPQFSKDADGYTIFKMHVTSDLDRTREPGDERTKRMLCQALLNLREYHDIVWLEHVVDPETGEVLIDTLAVPSQWRRLSGEPVPAPGTREVSYYEVVFTPSGVRCECPYAKNAPTPPEPTPWGDQPSGSTAPCAHSEIARFVRDHGLTARPRA